MRLQHARVLPGKFAVGQRRTDLVAHRVGRNLAPWVLAEYAELIPIHRLMDKRSGEQEGQIVVAHPAGEMVHRLQVAIIECDQQVSASGRPWRVEE